jgi:hypothetical protein
VHRPWALAKLDWPQAQSGSFAPQCRSLKLRSVHIEGVRGVGGFHDDRSAASARLPHHLGVRDAGLGGRQASAAGQDREAKAELEAEAKAKAAAEQAAREKDDEKPPRKPSPGRRQNRKRSAISPIPKAAS